MYIIKKLDAYILRKFLLLFVAAFFICLFVFMMQFTWRYIDELVGKGLTLTILAQFFWYMGLSLIPTSLPLAVLLASLITFGNMGEDLELLSMKAAGVSLLRVMRPVMLTAMLITGLSFYVQNKTAPEATISMRTLLISMKQASPAVEIPEGVFYNGVPNVNIYVQKKDVETGMLYQLIIYKTDQGFDRAQIVLADSGRLEMAADKMHLTLDLWSGEQFENLQSQGGATLGKASVPFDRETFGYKHLIIDFDSNFSLMDAAMLRDMPETKDLREIAVSVDSMNLVIDSLSRENKQMAETRFLSLRAIQKSDSAAVAKRLRGKNHGTFDEIIANATAEQMQTALQTCKMTTASNQIEWEGRGMFTGDTHRLIRRHWREWHRKFTLSLACLIFFFIGAPLGAIIRKGGLGMPTVISVFIFIIYYVIDTSSSKLARDGVWDMRFGMWMSTAVLTPLGIWLTYKANNDSVVFNAEVYMQFFRRLLGLRSKRHIARKEVIIEDPDYAEAVQRLQVLSAECQDYLNEKRLAHAPSYVRIFFRYEPDTRMEHIGEELESLVEMLANTTDRHILSELNRLPIIYTRAHVTPFNGRRRNIAAGLLLPLGLLLWWRIWRFRLRLLRDLKQIIASNEKIIQRIEQEGL